MVTARLLEGLNEAQREVVLHGEGPLLVVAGPGSGKTRVITHRLAYLMDRGVRPSHLLALTFTNKAAGEMRRRVEELAGHGGVWIGTFHSFCARLLRWYASLAGLGDNFSIYDRDDSLSALRQVLKELGPDFRSVRPSHALAQISRCKRELLTPEEYRQRCLTDFRADSALAEIYEAYQRRLRIANSVDFDDLLLLVVKLLAENEPIRTELDDRFQFIMVDEYQDTNAAQFEIIRLLSSRFRHVAVTGDPDQSIYGWRGADVKNILEFRRSYPDAKMVRLEQNYRSTPTILRVADCLIAHNAQRLDKSLVTERAEGPPVRLDRFPTPADEADAIAARIAATVHRGRYRPRDIAIFYRANHLSRVLEQALRRTGVPYQIVRGTEFFQRAEIKDMVAYLQLIYNQRCDEAFKRIVNVPTRGIGKTTVTRLTAFAADHGLSLLEAARAADRIDSLGKRAQQALQRFVDLMDELSRADTGKVRTLLEAVAERTGYLKSLEDSSDEEDQSRAANVHELIDDAGEFDEQCALMETDESPLELFLQHAALASDQDGLEESRDAVSLMTLHASKGLEFPVVFIVGLEQGILPHDRSLQSEQPHALEEERRLFFVGITRAQDELYLSLAAARGFGERRQPAVPSQFLQELPLEELQRSGLSGSLASLEWEEATEDTDADNGDWERSLDWDDESRQTPSVRRNPRPRSKVQISADAIRPASAWESADSMPAAGVQEGRSEQREEEGLEQGAVVTHPDYGLGKIVHCDGKGKNKTVRVQFVQETDPRSFRAAFAPLTVIRRSATERES